MAHFQRLTRIGCICSGLGTLTGIGALSLGYPDPKAPSQVSAVGLVFLGLLALLLKIDFKNQVLLVIDSRGVTLRWGKRFIPWRDITSTHLKTMNGYVCVCVQLKNAELYIPKRGLRALMRAGSWSPGELPLVVQTGYLDMPADEVMKLIEQGIAAHQ